MKKLLALVAPTALMLALAAPAGASAPALVTAADFPTMKQVSASFPELVGGKRQLRPTGTLARAVDCSSAVPMRARKSRTAAYSTTTSDVAVLVSVSHMKSAAQARKYVASARLMNRCEKVEVGAVETELTSRRITAPKLGTDRVGQAIEFDSGVGAVAYTFRKGARVIEVTAVYFDVKEPRAATRKLAKRAYRLGLRG